VSKKEIFSVNLILEAAAVICSLLYTYLYIEGSVWCWLFGALGALFFVYLTWKTKIFAETFLQLFYVFFAIYGFLTMGADFPQPSSLAVTDHIIWITVGIGFMGVVVWVLKKLTKAKMPWVDSFTTVYSLIATWLMVNNIHENWLYFIAVNTVAIFLYYKRGMYLGSVLFVLYLGLAIKGYFAGLT